VSHWKNRNVFVTGCTGLLGSSLTRHLVEQGANVVGLVRDGVPRSLLAQEGVLQKISVVHGALEDYTLLERALNEYEIEVVFHLAAQTIVGTANRSPLSTFEANIKGTWQLLEAARRVPTVKRVLFASSDKAYGDHEVLPYQEDAPLIGRHPYDVSKSCSDLIAQSYHHTYGMNVCITRCGNLYGPGDLNFNRLIPGTIRSLLNDEKPVIRSDGSYIRDYFFVEDGVEAYLHLAEAMDRMDIGGHAFNFSNELQITVLDLVNRLTQLMGRTDLAPVVLNQATGEIKHQYLSAEKARTMLDWHPRYTVEEGLNHTIAWYRNFLSENNQALPVLTK